MGELKEVNNPVFVKALKDFVSEYKIENILKHL